MPRPLAPAVLTAALVVGLTACLPDRPGTPGNDPEDTDGYVIGRGNEYVALGDSYTAAPGTGPYDEDDGCFRSLTNYPHRIAEATGVTLVDNSCSGASTDHLLQPQATLRGERPPQLTGIDDDTDLVTFRLGANDFGLIARIVQCAHGHATEPVGAPCTAADRRAGANGVVARLADLRTNLAKALTAIQDGAPEARIVVIGYPRLAPEEGTCPLLPLPAGDYALARTIMDGINAALEAAAAEAEAPFVDIADEADGHDICGEEPWVAGIRVPPGGRATPWHPFPQESDAVAGLVLEELEE